MRRRLPLLSIALLTLGLLAACSSGPAGSADSSPSSSAAAEKGAYPVTVKDAFGETTIEQAPKRVVTLGWSDQDTAIALGVVPVGATKISWGGNGDGSTPWFDAALKKAGGREPTRYDDSDGVPFEDIAALSPDLILATSSGITAADRQRLQKIAPVVAYPGKPFGTSWQDQTTLIGKALGRPAEAARLVTRTQGELDAFKAAHPELAGKSAVFATFDAKDTSQVGMYTSLDNRPQMLGQLGLTQAPIVQRLSAGNQDFWKTVSAERAGTVRSDVLVTYAEDAADEQRIKSDPLLSQIPAIKDGSAAFLLDKGESLSMSLPSVLAMPWFLRTIAPSIANAAAQAPDA